LCAQSHKTSISHLISYIYADFSERLFRNDQIDGLIAIVMTVSCRHRRAVNQQGDDMLFCVISHPRPERPSDVASSRQTFWPWIAAWQAKGVCKQIYPRVGRGAIAVFDVESNEMLHRILNEWADLIPAQFDVYPLVGLEATQAMLAAQVAAKDT